MKAERQLPGWLLLVTLAGCVRLGPDFQSPRQDWIDHWDSASLEQASQLRPQPDPRQWWTVFDDPLLERLIDQAEAGNPGLRIAALRILEARAQLGIARSGRYPQVQQGRAEALYLDQDQWDGARPQDIHAWQYGSGFDIA